MPDDRVHRHVRRGQHGMDKRRQTPHPRSAPQVPGSKLERSTLNEEDVNREIAATTAAAWAAGTGSIFDIVSKDVVWTVVGSGASGRTYRSLQEFFEGAFSPLKDRFAGTTKREICGIYADGNVIVLRWNGETGLVDGQTYRNRYVFILTMRDGVAVRVEEFCDLPTYEAAKAGGPLPAWETR